MPTAPNAVKLQGLELRAAIDPASYDPKSRTFVATFSTGVRVLRSPLFGDPFYEELEISDRAIRMGRLNAGTGVLLWHDRFTREGMVGVTTRGWVEKPGQDGQGDARVEARLSSRADVADVAQDVQDGILRSVSVGYRVYSYVDATTAEDRVRVLRAVDWEPMEVSLCSVPEDAQAALRSRGAEEPWEAKIETRASGHSGEDPMTKRTAQDSPNPAETPAATGDQVDTRGAAPTPTPAPAPAAPAPSFSQADVDERIRASRARADEIMRAGEAANVPLATVRAAIDGSASAADVRAEFARTYAAGGGPTQRSQVAMLQDERDTFRAAGAEALLTRFDPVRFPATERGRRYTGLSLLELGREALRMTGQDATGLPRMELARRTLATSDFPALLANVANKTLRQQYDAIPQAWRGTVARVGTTPDFKTFDRTQLSAAPSLLKVEEGEGIAYGGLSDGRQQYTLATYARKVAITRRAIVNDDLNGFARLPQLMAAAVRRLEDGLVYGVLTTNAVMSDSIALFNASHNNVITPALSQTGLSSARTKLRLQKGLANEELNLAPAYLIVPAALETTGRQLVSAEWVAQTPGTVNTFRGLQIIVHPLLDVVSSNSGPAFWWLTADSSQVDMLEVFLLEGDAGPVLEEVRDPDVDGFSWQIREDVVAGATDFRGLVRSDGTT